LDLLDNRTARDYTSQISHKKLMPSVTLLGSGFEHRTFLCFRAHFPQADDHLTPTSYPDNWLQLALPSAASSRAGLTFNCRISSQSKSESGLLYDCRIPGNQLILELSPFRLRNRVFFSTEPVRSQPLSNFLSDEGMGLSLIKMLGLCQVYISHI
jgi:hypothetical protein